MKDREAVCEKVRDVGLIYQQSVEGDSRTLKIKNRSRREGIPRVKSDGGSRNGPKVEGLDVVAGVELRRDGIFSSRLAATALYTTSPSVAYLRIDLRIHHNGKSAGLARHQRVEQPSNAQRSYLLCPAIWFRALRGRALTCRAARLYPRALTGSQA